MHIAVVQIFFAEESGPIHPKDAKNLCLKIKQRFAVLASFDKNSENEDHPYLFISMMASREIQLKTMYDNICEFCESSGFGRIAHQELFLRDMRSLFQKD